MKKKCRVYKCGGAVRKQMGGGMDMMPVPPMQPAKKPEDKLNVTQDSNQEDDIPQQKANNFMNWLQETATKKQIKEAASQPMMDPQMMMQPPMAQKGMSMMPFIPGHVENNRYVKAGKTGDMKVDPNMGAWASDLYNNQLDWNTPLNTIGTGAQQILGAPDVYKLKLPEGQDQVNFFEDYIEEGYQMPELSSLTVSDYKKDGKNRIVTLDVTGKQKYTGETYKDPNMQIQDPNKAMEENLRSKEEVSRILEEGTKPSPDAVEVTDAKGGFDWNAFSNQNTPTYTPPAEQTPEQWMEKNKDLVGMMSRMMAYGGYVPKAQVGIHGNNGVWFPGQDVFNTDAYNPTNLDPAQMQTTHGYMDFMHNLNTEVAQNTGTQVPEYDPMGVNSDIPGDREVTDQVQLELEKQGRLKTAMERNPYLASDMAIGAMKLATNIGSLDEQAERERAIRERVSNVHRQFQAQGADRGDYMVNVPGVGDFLKPDQHTRMGYNTKVAQMGGEFDMDDEVELTEEQIQDLIRKGYALEFID